MTNAVAVTASSALPLPATTAVETHMHNSSPEGTRPVLTFSPSTKFSELHVIRQRSAHSQESEDAVSDPDDLTPAQADGARERLCRDKARDAIRKEQVHMEGFLYKKAGGGASKAWNKRWCVLRSQALMIYKRHNEDKLKRVIRADDITDIHPVQRRNHSFVFEVETPSRSFFFEASSDQELDTWLARLKSVVVDINCVHSVSSGSNRPSAESCHAPLHPDDDISRMHFATASKATPKSPLENTPDAFLSLPTAASHRASTPAIPANTIFATLDTPHTISLMHTTSQQQDSSACAIAVLPPGVDHGHEPAPVLEDDDGDDEGEEDEEPNFHESQRREIETRLEEDRVILRGYLLKQDKLRQWRRRWFVLRQNTLSYYHDDKEYEVKQILRPDDIYDIRGPDPSTAKARSLRRTYFKVVSAKRNYWLAHDDAAVAREWFNALVLWNEPMSSSAFAAKIGGLASPPLPLRQSASAQPTVGGSGNNSAGLGQRVFSAFTSPSASIPHAPNIK
ncbi:hypothetical protein H4S07_003300 [Coemansia furcata]|uniref:Uncharacterized protein n=1 Tax=Coemansia furcata TaxID=417177 RepID=A0ACC1LI41_9FUNG|nr:hypothetical protein H4S07_003300 [Coemansia furcata]